MNNPLVPTPDVTELRLPIELKCVSNEYDEDEMINVVVLEGALDVNPGNAVRLPVPQDMATMFEVGKEYQVEVKVTIPDRAFTPFKAV